MTGDISDQIWSLTSGSITLWHVYVQRTERDLSLAARTWQKQVNRASFIIIYNGSSLLDDMIDDGFTTQDFFFL